MATIDHTFNALVKNILDNGKEYHNKKRDVKRLQIPSATIHHEFKDGFPAITSKKLFWKGVVGELLWFLKGDNDVKYLNENGIPFWNDDAYNWHVKTEGENAISREEFEKRGEGSVGRNYSVQWRDYNGKTDQIKYIIDLMNKDIMSSQILLNAWNPSELQLTALPPCHYGFQIIGIPMGNGEFGFELHYSIRSQDLFLGAPINLASYALLAKILEKITGYKALAVEGNLKCVHFYDNQYEAAKELLSREITHPNCEVSVPECVWEDGLHYIQNLEINDFKLIGYESHEAIKVEMLAPKSI